jgi:hypothetical protein
MDISMEDHGALDAESARALAEHADAEFNGMAMVLFALQFGCDQPYQKLCEARGTRPNEVTHWAQIPAVPTSAFKEWEITCLAPEQRSHVFHSSGTTEQRPSRHFHCAESLEIYEASLWAWFDSNVAADVRRLTSITGKSQSLVTSAATYEVVCLTPPPVQAPHSSLVHMFEVVRQRLGAPENVFVGRVGVGETLTLDLGAAVAALTGNDTQPVLVLGTAFSFVHLLDELKARNQRLQLPSGSLVMETGGYKGRSRELPKAELHTLVTEWLGIPKSNIICEYGMSELSSQAYDLKVPSSDFQVSGLARVFHFPPWARVQVVSPETGREVGEGETGLIRVFDLANVFSVMAIQTEDLAVRRGDGFELIGRAKLAEPRGCSLMAT